MTSVSRPRTPGARLRAALLCVLLALGSLLVAGPAQAAGGSWFAGGYAGLYGVRDYHGYLPSSYLPGERLPLVVALHGCTENDVGFDILSGWSALAEERGFIVVFPDQNNLANPAGCWNWFLPANQHRGVGEPSLIAGITARVADDYRVDPDRTYVTGVSAGGVMANIMTVAYPDVFAAGSILAGCEYHCDVTRRRTPEQSGADALAEMGSRARPVPTLIFQGTADPVVAPVTADRIAGQWTTVAGTDAVADSSVPGQVPGGRSYTHRGFADDTGRVVVEQYLVDGAGHAYPGGCACSLYGDPAGPDATGLTWDFFAAHPMP